MSKRARYLAALLFDPEVATEIDGLRRALGSAQRGRIPPHVTLVPPTNVAAAEMGDVEALVRSAAGAGEPFDVELGPPQLFPGNPRVLFLGVAFSDELLRLRSRLLAGPFAQRGEERRPFAAHVTLESRDAGAFSEGLIDGLSSYVRWARVSSLTLMIQEDEVATRPWRVAAEYDLGTESVVGRGGIEVVLHSGRGLSEATATAIGSFTGEASEPLVPDGGAFFSTATVGSRIVGAGSWRLNGDVVELGCLVVDPSFRDRGVGTRLLSFVESLERSRGRAVLEVRLDRQSQLADYFVGRGYRAVTEDASFRDTTRLVFRRVLSER